MLPTFSGLAKEIHAYDAQREKVITASRQLIRSSKELIYAVHRQDKKKVGSKLKEMRQARKKLEGITKKIKGLEKEPIYDEALGEYVEAITFQEFMSKGSIPSAKQLKVSAVQYLLGLSDLTGELGRQAVMLATKGKKEKVQKIRDAVEHIHGGFLHLSLRNSHLRRKADAVKYNLRKCEEVVYDLHLK